MNRKQTHILSSDIVARLLSLTIYINYKPYLTEYFLYLTLAILTVSYFIKNSHSLSSIRFSAGIIDN